VSASSVVYPQVSQQKAFERLSIFLSAWFCGLLPTRNHGCVVWHINLFFFFLAEMIQRVVHDSPPDESFFR
jgi:hypothetical protein